MASRKLYEKKVAVVGSGNFGTAIANILAENCRVMLYVRNSETAQAINESRTHRGQAIHANVTITQSLEDVATQCEVIFPIVPASHFRTTMKMILSLYKQSIGVKINFR